MNTSYLEIVTVNSNVSLQDLGRLTAQHLGFSVSGAADEHAYLYANKLIADHQKQIIDENNGKQQAFAALEITLGQVTFRANASCTLAITGADCQVQLNKKAISNWQCHHVKAGDMITFAMPKSGLHSYLAIWGGFTLLKKQLPWLGSFSQTANEMTLGVMGQQLTAGSKLFFSKPISPTTVQSQQEYQYTVKFTRQYKPNAPELFYSHQQITLRFIASKLFLHLPIEKQQSFLANTYVISADSNRMGYRLVLAEKPTFTKSGQLLSTKLRADCALSKPVTYGMIQLPANEQPIILMKERQTMGGYPVLGSVMQTDLFRLSQMRPGEKVRFSFINYPQAQQQLQAFYQKWQ